MRWTVERLVERLQRLAHEPADALEDETLEIKGRPRDLRQLTEWAVLAAVCLANARGGTLLIGVRDRVTGVDQALAGSGPVDYLSVRRFVYDGTSPPILVDLESFNAQGVDLLAVHVPQGLPPHTTSGGCALIRVGKDCVPLTGAMWGQQAARSGSMDRSSLLVEAAAPTDIDAEAAEVFVRLLSEQPAGRRLSSRPIGEALRRLDLARDGRLTMAALLLLGRRERLAELAPEHEVTLLRMDGSTRYGDRDDLHAPLLVILQRVEERLEAWLGLRTARPRGLSHVEFREITWEVAREAFLNAVAHRDYFIRSAVILAVHPDAVVVDNPGGFVGGVRPDNVLRHGVVHRNPLLCRALHRLGLVNRVGLGVERMYDGLLRLGCRPPVFGATESRVDVRLERHGSDALAAWVVESERSGRQLSTDELIVVRSAMDVGELDRWSAAVSLQVDGERAAEQLALMRRQGLLAARGRGRSAAYHLSAALAERLIGQAVGGGRPATSRAGLRAAVLDELRRRERLTNTQVRELTGLDRGDVLALFRGLAADGLVAMQGAGRGAHVVLARRPDEGSSSGEHGR